MPSRNPGLSNSNGVNNAVSQPYSSHRHNERHLQNGGSQTTGMTTTLLKLLTRVQRLSATFLSLFVAIHLTAPIAANFGGSELSNGMLLLGREYYQRSLTEPLLLYIPLGVHVGSGLARRWILGAPKRPGLVTQTAYLAIGAVPIHIFIHRIAPSFSTPPISSFSPSEMNFEFVKVAFDKWPALSWIAYGGLVGVVLLHMCEGASIIFRWFTGKTISKRTRRTISGVAATAVLTGVYRMTSEPVFLRGLQYQRVIEIHRQFPTYRLL